MFVQNINDERTAAEELFKCKPIWLVFWMSNHDLADLGKFYVKRMLSCEYYFQISCSAIGASGSAVATVLKGLLN
jgi:hypothetical protein